MVTNIFLAEPSRIRTYLHYYRLKLKKKHIQVCSLVEYVYHSIISSDSWLHHTQLVSVLPADGFGIGLRPNMCWHICGEDSVIKALQKGMEEGSMLSLWIHEQPFHSFHHPSDWEREHQHYFDHMRQTWETDFRKIKINQINLILDLYNEYMQRYQLTSNPMYVKSAQSLLEQLRNPY